MFEVFRVEVNLIAILLASITYILFGAMWHSRFAFGRLWEKLAQRQMKPQKSAIRQVIWALMASLFLALGLNSILQYSFMLSGLPLWPNALVTGFLTASTISATTMFNTVLWEGKSIKLFLFNYIHQLISYILMCIVISLFI